MIQIKNKVRIPELDLMRGLAMIFVIIGHILELGLHTDNYPRAFMGILQI